MADYLPPVVAKLTGDDSGLARTFTQAEARARKFAADVGKISAIIKIDVKLKDGALAEVRTKVKDAPAAQLTVKLALATGERDRIRRLATTPSPTMQVKLGLVTGAKAALAEKLKQGDVSVRVKPVMDQQALARVRIVLRELGKRIDVPIRPTIHQPSQVAAEARLVHLARDRTATIHTMVLAPPGGGGRGTSGILSTLLSLAPALVPVAASLTASAAQIVASVGAGAVAVGAFGLAVAPQIKQLGTAATAQTAYSKAVAKYGPYSQQAATAQVTLNQSLDGMPPATRAASAALVDLKGNFKSWSNQLAGFTMAPVEKSFAVVEGILPKLTPMVKGTSDQLDRLVTIAGGEVASPGFDSMMARFSTFANGALKHGVDDVIHFSRVLSEGGGNGPISQFMDYAKQEGPAVRETLANIAKAISQVLQGASEAGPGILSLVNAAAKLVAALPSRFIATAMQLYTAFKLIGLTKTGFTAVSGAATTMATRLIALRAASTAAGGGLAGVRAALATLSTGTKVAGAIGVIAGIVLVLNELGSSGKHAPDVDRMTTAVGQLGRTSKMSGELLSTFGKDMDGFAYAVDRVAGNASGMDKFNDIMNKVFTLGLKKSNSANDAKKQIDAIDQGLASLVQGGKADLAAASVARLAAEYKKSGEPASNLTGELKKYKSALADAKFEADLTADSMGTFGSQAQRVQKQLDAQKLAAQGLQQAILDLNDANRAGLDAESDYQQAIDDATKAIKGHGSALHFTNGELDLGTQASRDAYEPLSKLASTAEAAATAAIAQGKSQGYANGILIDAHAQLVKAGEAMGLTSKEANKLADQLDNIKDPKIKITGTAAQLNSTIASAKKQLAAMPKIKTAALKADASQLNSVVREAQNTLKSLHDKTVSIKTTYSVVNGVGTTMAHEGGGYASGAVVSGGVRRMAEGGFGRPAMMARGGANILWGEGPDESYIPHDRRPRSKAIAEKTVGIMGGSVNWGGSTGGSPSASAVPLGAQVAKGLWAGMDGQSGWLAAQAKAFAIKTIPVPIADALGIKSPSKVAASLGRWVGYGMVQGLTGSTASVKSATLRLSRSIEQVFHDDAARQIASDKKQLASLAGQKGKKAAAKRADLRDDVRYQQHLMDSGIAKYVATDNARLLKLAGQRDSVATKLKAAQSKLANLQKEWTTEKNNIASSITQGVSLITTSPQEGAALTGADVLNNLKDQANKVAQFSAQLQELKKKGLSASLIDQIASAGFDQGGATAAALASASSDTIKQINSTQKGITLTAQATGKTVADAMYGAGISSAKGLVKGLQSQEKSIDAQMLKIAKSMEKAIKKALGIKSPSTVMAQLGDHTARGYAMGIDRSAKHAVIAARGMAMSVRQGAAMGGSLTGALSGTAGGGTVIHHHYHAEITVEGSVTTERKLIDAVQTGLLRVATRNPTTYPSFKR